MLPPVVCHVQGDPQYEVFKTHSVFEPADTCRRCCITQQAHL